MKRLLAYLLGVLGINVLATFAALFAFILLLFRGDPILAAVPAILALPAIVLQPWFLVFLFLPNALVLAPILTTVVTILVYGWLDAGGKLDRPKTVLARFKTRKTAVVVSGFVLLLIAIGVARHVDFPPLNNGVPSIVDLSAFDVTDARYYNLGSFIDSEGLARARVPESELARLADKLGLHPIEREGLSDEFRSMPPYWWHPSVTVRTKVFSTTDFPTSDRGPDGRHMMATWSPDDEVLYLWIKNNF